jgi:hypothetical protein
VAAVDCLSLTDLFLVGLVLDISGAVLLAKGLLLSPRALARMNTMYGSAYEVHEDRIRNRVYAEFGLLYLATGFGLQAIGYALDIGGVKAETGTGRLIVALVTAAVVGGLAWAVWELRHGARIEALGATVAAEHPAAAEEIEAAAAGREKRES